MCGSLFIFIIISALLIVNRAEIFQLKLKNYLERVMVPPHSRDWMGTGPIAGLP